MVADMGADMEVDKVADMMADMAADKKKGEQNWTSWTDFGFGHSKAKI